MRLNMADVDKWIKKFSRKLLMVAGERGASLPPAPKNTNYSRRSQKPTEKHTRRALTTQCFPPLKSHPHCCKSSPLAARRRKHPTNGTHGGQCAHALFETPCAPGSKVCREQGDPIYPHTRLGLGRKISGDKIPYYEQLTRWMFHPKT